VLLVPLGRLVRQGRLVLQLALFIPPKIPDITRKIVGVDRLLCHRSLG